MIWQTNIVCCCATMAHLNFNLAWKEAIRGKGGSVWRGYKAVRRERVQSLIDWSHLSPSEALVQLFLTVCFKPRRYWIVFLCSTSREQTKTYKKKILVMQNYNDNRVILNLYNICPK